MAFEGKLLLVVLHPNDDVKNDYYCTVGGGLDDGEGLIEGLRREVIEETGIEPVVGRLLFVQQYSDKNDNIEFFFHVTNAQDYLSIDLSKSTHGSDEIKEIGYYDTGRVTILPKFLENFDFGQLNDDNPVKFYSYLHD